MKLGISHITFKDFSFEETLKKLEGSPIKGLEIAPTLLWDSPLESSSVQRREIRDLLETYGIEPIGLQSVLYGQPQLKLFDSTSSRASCLNYLKRTVELCHDLGGSQISFGSPQNRRRGNLDMPRALAIACPFFQQLAVAGNNLGVIICFEPLAPGFSCDFINTAEEGNELIQLVDHPSFRLLLDTGNLAMNGELVSDVLTRYFDILHHVQVNDPMMKPPGSQGVNHENISELLRVIKYEGWITIECFLRHPNSLAELTYAINCYGQVTKK